MLRQDVTERSPVWANALPKIQNTVKSTVINLLSQALSARKLTKVCKLLVDIIGVLTAHATRTGWPTLLPFVVRLLKAKDAVNVSCGLELVASIAEYSVDELSSILPQVHKSISSILEFEVKSTEQKSLTTARVSAVKALTSLLISLDVKGRPIQEFAKLTIGMFNIMAALARTQKDLALEDCIEKATQLTEYRWNVISPHADKVVQLLVKIASHQDIDEANRRLALQMIVKMAKHGRTVLRNLGSVGTDVIPIAFSYLKKLDFTLEEWTARGSEGDFDEEDLRSGMETLDYLACYLGGKVFFPSIWAIIRPALSSKNWLDRHAALMAICASCEGCAEVIVTQLEPLTRAIVSLIDTDPQPRVRWDAVNAVANLCREFSPALQQACANLILPPLIRSMTPGNNIRVAAHAALCIVDFCSGDETQQVAKFLQPLLKALLTILGNSNVDPRIESSCFAALAALAQTAGGEAFARYYSTFMPGVMTYLEVTVKSVKTMDESKMTQQLRWKREARCNAIFCVGVMAESVGSRFFEKDAKRCMTLLAEIAKHIKSGDPTRGRISAAFCSISQCLEEKFSPYLSYVVPPLLRAALDTEDPYSAMDVRESQGQAKEGFEYVHVDIRGKPTQHVKVNTALIEAKMESCAYLGLYALNCPKAFFKYLEPATKAIVPLIMFTKSRRVRVHAVDAIPNLMECANKHGKGFGQRILLACLEKFVESLQAGHEPEETTRVLSSLSQCIQHCTEPLDAQRLQYINQSLLKSIQVSIGRLQEYKHRMGQPIDDSEKEEIRMDVALESEMMGYTVGLVKALAEKNGNTYLLSFHKQLLPVFSTFLQDKSSTSLQTAGVCCLCDVMEANVESKISREYADRLLPFCLKRCLFKSIDIRHSAAYAVGVCAMLLGREQFTKYCKEAVTTLSKIITAPDGRKGENAVAADNAISSICKIIDIMGGDVSKMVLPRIVSWLPCKSDDMEAPAIHKYFCKFLEGEHKGFMFGQNQSNLPKIFGIFAEVCSQPKLASEETRKRMCGMAKRFLDQLGADGRQRLQTVLSKEHLNVIKVMVSGRVPNS